MLLHFFFNNALRTLNRKLIVLIICGIYRYDALEFILDSSLLAGRRSHFHRFNHGQNSKKNRWSVLREKFLKGTLNNQHHNPFM